MKIASATIRILNRACAIVALAIALAVVPYAVPVSTASMPAALCNWGQSQSPAAPPCSRAQSAPRPRAAR